jgi:branched-subunit amino acid aminotransferase/4-amino-4-deoxychorismate lyase
MRTGGPEEEARLGAIWLNGHLLSKKDARVSPLGTSRVRGVGLFETMRVTGRRVPLLERHLERLARGCRLLGLPDSPNDLEAGVDAVLRHDGLHEGVARIVVGEGFRMVTSERLPPALHQEKEKGIRLACMHFSWGPVAVKHTSRAALERAERETGGETARIGSRQRLLETTRSNFFVVGTDALQTAPTSVALPGIARGLILELATQLGLPVRQRAPRLSEFASWREVFVTNAVRGVRPVIELGGKRLPPPQPRGVLRELQQRVDHAMGLRP